MPLTDKERKYQRDWAKNDRVKNPEKYRLYQRNWRKKNREERNRKARIWFKENPDKRREYERQYRKNHRKEYNERRMKQNREKWIEVMEKLGSDCFFCHFRGKRRISFHEKNGKKHLENPYYVLKHLQDFVPLCEHCHKAIHFCIKYLSLSWKQIIEIHKGVK